MSLVEINWHPSRKELRCFATVFLIAAVVVSLLLHVLKGLDIRWVAIISVVGIIVFLGSFVSLKAARMVYLGLVLGALPIGWVVSVLLLAIFYFGLISPLSIVFRLIGRDVLGRKFDRNVGSYWIAHRAPEDPERYFHQF